MKIELCIFGKPFGKQRPRFTKRGVTYTPSETSKHEKEIALAYRQKYGALKFPPQVPLGVTVTAYLPIPKNAPKYKIPDMLSGVIRPAVKPDWDNIAKLVCDALNGVAFDDDKQIVSARVEKLYGETPKTVVTVYTLK